MGEKMKKIILFLMSFLVFMDVKAEGAVTYLNLNKSEKITIQVEGTIEVKLNQTNDININEFSTYQGIFMSKNEDLYPLYIIENDGQYSFSDTRKNARNVYMLSSRLHKILINTATTDISTCDGLFGYQLINLLKNNVFKMIYVFIPLLLIVLSTLDFAKLVFSDEKEGIPKAFKRFTTRVVASILIFLVPTILLFLVNLLGSKEIETCINTFKTTENISENG